MYAKIFIKGHQELSWKKNGKMVKFKKKYTRITTGYNKENCVYYLSIEEATMNDSGEYSVTATNKCGSVTSSVTVNVSANDVCPLEKQDNEAVKEIIVTETKDESENTKAKESRILDVGFKEVSATNDDSPATTCGFVKEPASNTVSEGETIRLSCQISGTALPIILCWNGCMVARI